MLASPFPLSCLTGPHSKVHPPIDPFKALERTEASWRQWSDRCPHVGPWTDAVKRSLITLKALTYAPMGGIVAAATTSLPERSGTKKGLKPSGAGERPATPGQGCCLFACLGGQSPSGFEGSSAHGNDAYSPRPRQAHAQGRQHQLPYEVQMMRTLCPALSSGRYDQMHHNAHIESLFTSTHVISSSSLMYEC